MAYPTHFDLAVCFLFLKMATTVVADNEIYATLSVIVHGDLAESALVRRFKQKQIKIRTSWSVVKGSVIFPKAKVAFLIVELTKPATDGCPGQISSTSALGASDIERMDKFVNIHGHCYIVLQAPLFTDTELSTLSFLQTNYLQHKVDVLPAHSYDDCMTAMLTIVSLQIPPKSDLLHQRFCDLMTDILKPFPVKKF
ncbi:uncharacterized protein LOC131954100 [Physella acuta]|uniref:uncharacterized protein LOC131954100 n=1 Tax=Physella acuta TaxID=109671 RepID=UPI0027DDFF64|nr:uncharacterized protein LOC131954100 [Physella acuta]